MFSLKSQPTLLPSFQNNNHTTNGQKTFEHIELELAM
jgi:hypothetical protein